LAAFAATLRNVHAQVVDAETEAQTADEYHPAPDNEPSLPYASSGSR
jgi:hypothetical protein